MKTCSTLVFFFFVSKCSKEEEEVEKRDPEVSDLGFRDSTVTDGADVHSPIKFREWWRRPVGINHSSVVLSGWMNDVNLSTETRWRRCRLTVWCLGDSVGFCLIFFFHKTALEQIMNFLAFKVEGKNTGPLEFLVDAMRWREKTEVTHKRGQSVFLGQFACKSRREEAAEEQPLSLRRADKHPFHVERSKLRCSV